MDVIKSSCIKVEREAKDRKKIARRVARWRGSRQFEYVNDREICSIVNCCGQALCYGHFSRVRNGSLPICVVQTGVDIANRNGTYIIPCELEIRQIRIVPAMRSPPSCFMQICIAAPDHP